MITPLRENLGLQCDLRRQRQWDLYRNPARVPKIVFKHLNYDYGNIQIFFITGRFLEMEWDTLDEKNKESICLPLWDMFSKVCSTPRPPELKSLFQCLDDRYRSRGRLLEGCNIQATPWLMIQICKVAYASAIFTVEAADTNVTYQRCCRTL